jgi:Kef-type K+ transport system membrane component KefB
MATAPASTLMVIRECDSEGPLTDNLLGIIAVNNLLCISAYAVVAATIDLTSGLGGTTVLNAVYQAAYPFVWQLGGSVALGYLVGLLLAGWSTQVTETGEMLILLAGSILLCVGVARLLDLSPLVASLAVGATMVNLTARSRRLFSTLSGTDPPFYAIFFVLAGADLDLSLVPSMGIVGVVYVLGRAIGKFVGAVAGARWLRLDPKVQYFLGFGLIAQAGLAVGLTIAIDQRYDDFAPIVSTVVLSSVAIFEMVGPISTRFALVGSGEAGRSPSAESVSTALY